jgi:Holliday junction resolvasome RuvABC endonuclease subunit
LRYIASGTIKTGTEGALPPRLKVILNGVSEIIATYQPACAAIEKVFVNVNLSRPCCSARRAAPRSRRSSVPTSRWRNTRPRK